MTERIIALDPGGTTGWAMWQDTPFGNAAQFDGLWSNITCGQLGPEPHHLALYELHEHMCTEHYTIVDESFQFRQMDNDRTGTNLISREYIGISRLFAAQRPREVQYLQQSPAQAKGFVSDEKLQIMGLWVPGQRHARDALRHLVFFLVNRRHMHNLIKPWKDLQ